MMWSKALSGNAKWAHFDTAPAAQLRRNPNAAFTRPAEDLTRRCRLKAVFRGQTQDSPEGKRPVVFDCHLVRRG